jgi:hypothetical protein
MGWQLMHHQGTEDALAMALDEGWALRQVDYAPGRVQGADRSWAAAAIAGIAARVGARRGQGDAALALLARPVRALRQAPAWAPNYTRTACDVAETLWLLDRHDHLAVVEPVALSGPRGRAVTTAAGGTVGVPQHAVVARGRRDKAQQPPSSRHCGTKRCRPTSGSR